MGILKAICPQGKTPAIITQNINQTELKKNDCGYIDGYVRAGDSRPYAVFVRGDGHIDLAPVFFVKALLD